MDEMEDPQAEIEGLAQAPKPALSIGERLPRHYVSVSQINQYLKCGKAYEFRYIDELPIQRNSFMVQGSALHSAAEMLHLVMVDGGAPPPLDMITDAYSDAHKQMFTPDVRIMEEDISVEHTKNVGLKLAEMYYMGATGALGLPPVRPVAAERKIYTALRPLERDPYPFLGIIDLEEPETVADVKTKRKKGSQGEVDNSLQLSLYAAATGKPDVRLDQLIKPTKTIGPRYERLRATRTVEEMQHAIEIGADVVDGILEGRFPRSAPDAWWCTPDWCPYWTSCRGKKL